MLKKFTDHPSSLGKTYYEHLIHASGLAWKCNKICIALIIHSLFPFLFTEYASKNLKELADEKSFTDISYKNKRRKKTFRTI